MKHSVPITLVLTHIRCRKRGDKDHPEPLYCTNELLVELFDRHGRPHQFSFEIDASEKIEHRLRRMATEIETCRRQLAKLNLKCDGVPPGWGREEKP